MDRKKAMVPKNMMSQMIPPLNPVTDKYRKDKAAEIFHTNQLTQSRVSSQVS